MIVVKGTVIHYSVVFVMLDVLKLKIQLCGEYAHRAILPMPYSNTLAAREVEEHVNP